MPRTRLTELLGLRHPVVSAPMILRQSRASIGFTHTVPITDGGRQVPWQEQSARACGTEHRVRTAARLNLPGNHRWAIS